MIERRNPLFAVTQVTRKASKLEECSMFWIMLIVFPQTSNFRIKKLCCMCLKTTKQCSRRLSKVEVPQWDMFPVPTELPLIGCLIESIWTQKSKSSTLTPKTNSQTCWPRDISHVTNGIIFCVCSISAISVLQFAVKWCQKKRKKESGEKRLTAKSRPMMSLIARAPSTLSSSASESPEKRSYESQSPLSAKAEEYDRTGKPVVGRDTSHAPGHHHKQFVESLYSARYSQWDDDKAWSSQEWKYDELIDDRTGTPVVCPQRGAQQFIIGDDETELDLSLGSRSFLDRVNDQVRKRHKTIFDECYRKRRKTFCDMGNVHVCNIGISSIHGKELLRHLAFHQEYKRPHNETNVRHICEIGVRTRWDLWSENNWLGKFFMEVFVIDWWWTGHQSSAHKGLRLFRFCIASWQDTLEHPIKQCMGTKIGVVQNFSGTQKLGQNWRHASQMLISFLYIQEDLEQDTGHFSILVQRKVVFYQWVQSTKWMGQNGRGDKWWHSQKADTQSSVPRVLCPEVSTEAKAVENCRYTIKPIWKRLKLFFASHNYFCKSAQSFRSSCRNVWRTWNLSWWNGETRCGRAVEFVIRAKRDQDRISFG